MVVMILLLPLPKFGYNFECSEIRSAQGRSIYVCDSSLTEFDFIGTPDDVALGSVDDEVAARYDEIFSLVEEVDYHSSGRKRRKSKVCKSNENQCLTEGSVVVDVADACSGNRFRHKCPHCLRTVRGYSPDMKVALRRHWVWLCRISGTKKVDIALQVEDGVFVCPSSQLPPQNFLHSDYYKLAMYRKSGEGRVEERGMVSLISFSWIWNAFTFLFFKCFCIYLW